MLNFFDGRAPLCVLYKIYSGLVKRMLAILLCLSYIDFITYIDSVLFSPITDFVIIKYKKNVPFEL